MKTLFVTRPLDPPWNEGTKNLFSQIVPLHSHFSSLTSAPTSNSLNIYKSPQWNTKNKLILTKHLTFNPQMKEFDQFVFAFSPNAFNIRILSNIVKKRFSSKRIIQFIPSLDPQLDLKKMLIGDKFIVISNFTHDRLVQAKVDPSNILLLNPFVNTGMLDTFVSTAQTHETNKINILYLGEYSKRLGSFPFLYQLGKKLLATYPNVTLTLACRLFSKEDQKQENIVKNSLAEQGFENRVSFLNFVPEVYQLIQDSTFMVFPATHMGDKFDIPLVLLESLYLNKPTFVSNIAPLPEAYKFDQELAHKYVLENDVNLWLDAIAHEIKKPQHTTQTLQTYVNTHFSLPPQQDKIVSFLTS